MSKSAAVKKRSKNDEVESKPRRLRLAPAKGLGMLGAIGLGGLVVILFAIVAFQAFIVGNQSQLDQLNQQISEAEKHNQQLRLEVAELESPERILGVAMNGLGMVQPDRVVYLPPIPSSQLAPSTDEWQPDPDTQAEVETLDSNSHPGDSSVFGFENLGLAE